jgi:hypothetical protein
MLHTCICVTLVFIGIMFADTSDVVEGDVENGGCKQNCTNTRGSYICSCDTGYILNADQHAFFLQFLYLHLYMF